MHKTRFRKGQQFGKWKLSKFIGAGGNGEVWRATLFNDASKIVAIKLLKRINNEGYARFKDEVNVLAGNKDIKGVLTMIDYYLPETPKGQTPWYSMPLATPLMKYIERNRGRWFLECIVIDSMVAVLFTPEEEGARS